MIGNFQHRGFYRVNYDANGWKMIIDQLSRDFTVGVILYIFYLLSSIIHSGVQKKSHTIFL